MATSLNKLRGEKCTVTIDNLRYELIVQQTFECAAAVPRLVVVAYQPTKEATNILRACIHSIKAFTSEAHELWVVDNNSPPGRADWLFDVDNINVVINTTLPTRSSGLIERLRGSFSPGSYANAVGIEIVRKFIQPASHYFMTLHMDTLAIREGWLTFLRRKIDHRVRAAGVRMDQARVPEGVLHVLGCISDYQLVQQLGLDFFPHLPRYDVGDRITVGLREAGFQVYACRNTLWSPELIHNIENPKLRDLTVDRSLDDDGNVIFLHLGRGVRKASRQANVKGLSGVQWVRFAQNYVPVHSNEV